MSWTNSGAGCPNFFQCSKCRQKNTRKKTVILGTVSRVVLTGKTRKTRPYQNIGPRMTDTHRQYTCKDCGHTGWSRHVDLERKARYEASGATDDGLSES